jgi:hypothetical protein
MTSAITVSASLVLNLAGRVVRRTWEDGVFFDYNSDYGNDLVVLREAIQ